MAYKNKRDQLESQRNHYIKNKQKIIAKVSQKRKEKLDFIRSLKDNPCLDCGKVFHHYAMDFDHVIGVKKRDISKMTSFSIANILEEVKKCELVCANCHRIRTFNRKYPLI